MGTARKPGQIQKFFAHIVKRVDDFITEHGHGADQNIFWQAVDEMRRVKDPEKFGFMGLRQCGKQASCTPNNPLELMDYCEMDPWMHPTGWEDADQYLDTLVTYHANYATNNAKIPKLVKVHGWGFFDH